MKTSLSEAISQAFLESFTLGGAHWSIIPISIMWLPEEFYPPKTSYGILAESTPVFTGASFYLPIKTLSKIFRAKFRDKMETFLCT
jgi:hypothetical protein